MEHQNPHPTDEELLLELDGEVSPNATKKIQAHLGTCWACRSRRHDLESAVIEFTRFHVREYGSSFSSTEGPQALLKAQLANINCQKDRRNFWWLRDVQRRGLAFVAAGLMASILALVFFGLVVHHPANAAVFSVPNSRLTPGATVLADRQTICHFDNVKNKAVSTAMQKRVFEEYGIRGVASKFYEVDYLVTPALGGADDIRNLWPHSYSAAWNAKVKDDLEDRLREMVCSGELELSQAQKDIATNWIAAYKKYFHTDQPLPVH